LLGHVAGRTNLTLLAPRGISTQHWRHALVVGKPANDCVISNESREANQVFLLWRYGAENVKLENLSLDFRSLLDGRYEHHYTPKEILGYIYAVLHAPTYRVRYANFLRIDFRWPLVSEGRQSYSHADRG
jgi:predicted helicase